jgi:hypothetical protein
MSLRHLIVVACVVVGLAGPRLGAFGLSQGEQQQAAQQLLSADARARWAGLALADTIPVERLTPELRLALIAALEREGQRLVARYRARRGGEALPPLEDPEFIGAVSRAVARLRDPRAIPALAGALGTGFTVIDALAAFGELAAPAVLAVVTSPESMPDAVNHGLITLRFMVEAAETRPLSADTWAQIRGAAAQRLATGAGLYLTTLWRAIDLAVVLKDPALRRTVESLASDRHALVARGVTDPEDIDRTQKRAADRLAGIPPLPRR